MKNVRFTSTNELLEIDDYLGYYNFTEMRIWTYDFLRSYLQLVQPKALGLLECKMLNNNLCDFLTWHGSCEKFEVE